MICENCGKCCIGLDVDIIMGFDDIPENMIKPYTFGWIMKRRKDNSCIALDLKTKKCIIYDRRPKVCRDFEFMGWECVHERNKE